MVTMCAAMERLAHVQGQTMEQQNDHQQHQQPRSNTLRPLPEHYLFSNKPGQSFVDHIERLRALQLFQNLSDDDFVKTIKCSLKDGALRVATSIDIDPYLGTLHGSRDYIAALE